MCSQCLCRSKKNPSWVITVFLEMLLFGGAKKKKGHIKAQMGDICMLIITEHQICVEWLSPSSSCSTVVSQNYWVFINSSVLCKRSKTLSVIPFRMVQHQIWKGMLMPCFSPICQKLLDDIGLYRTISWIVWVCTRSHLLLSQIFHHVSQRCLSFVFPSLVSFCWY